MEASTSAWIIGLAFASAFGSTMLAAGTRLGRQRAITALAEQLERGTFRLESADGKPVTVQELSSALGSELSRPAAAPRYVLAIALAVACAGALLAFLIVSSRS